MTPSTKPPPPEAGAASAQWRDPWRKPKSIAAAAFLAIPTGIILGLLTGMGFFRTEARRSLNLVLEQDVPLGWFYAGTAMRLAAALALIVGGIAASTDRPRGRGWMIVGAAVLLVTQPLDALVTFGWALPTLQAALTVDEYELAGVDRGLLVTGIGWAVWGVVSIVILLCVTHPGADNRLAHR